MSEKRKIIMGSDKDKNLEILKSFYENVWGKYTHYVENDKVLYKVFDNKNDVFADRVRISILNNFYSAGMKNIQIYDFKEKVGNLKSADDIGNIGKNCYHGYGNKMGHCNFLISLESKYLHWITEAVGLPTIPIYDANVKDELKNYELEDSDLSRKIESKKNEYTKLKKTIDAFIKKYFNKSGSEYISLEMDFHNQVSIYRLVDKFLWLSNKFYHLANKVKDIRMTREGEKNILNSHERTLQDLQKQYETFLEGIIKKNGMLIWDV